MQAGDVPFVVAMTGSSDSVSWSGAAGEHVLGQAATPKTIFRIFSMTKAIGSTAAMILIDRGQLRAETPVEEILPEFAGMRVLEGFDNHIPRLRSPKTQATVRHLATHTSGLVYEFWNGDLAQYLTGEEHPSIGSGQKTGLAYPLVFDPGQHWGYGIGIDWLGRIVEEVDGRRIDDFCHEEIFKPLGMVDTDFEIQDHVGNRLARVTRRTENGRFIDINIAPPSTPEFYGMGHALYSTAPDYMRFLRMFLNGGQLDGHRILSSAGMAAMFENQIGNLRVTRMTSVAPHFSASVEFFPGVEKGYSFGFMRMEEDVSGMRAAGSLGWAGLLNTHYWFDPARDVIGLLMTQILPFADNRFMRLHERLERAVYADIAGPD